MTYAIKRISAWTLVLVMILCWAEPGTAYASSRIEKENLAPKSLWKEKSRIESQERWLNDRTKVTVLYKLDEASDDTPSRMLMFRFSEYKYGASRAIHFFVKRLASVIRASHGEAIAEDPNAWMVVSPPYMSIPSPSQALANNLAKELGLPRIRLHLFQTTKPVMSYSALESKSAREQAIESQDFFVKRPEKLSGKKIILVDDVINTGVTLQATAARLKSQYRVSDIFFFGIVSLETSKPHLEEWANSLLLRTGRLNHIVGIFNDPETVINKYAVARILAESEEIQRAIISGLSEEALSKFYEAVEHFYFGLEQTDEFRRFQNFLINGVDFRSPFEFAL